MITVRRYHPDDRAACAAVFFRAVREGTLDHTTKEQREDWAPSPLPDLTTPDPRDGQDCWVSLADGQITGFMALDKAGYLDMAFVLPEVMGQGHAAALYDHLLDHARSSGLTRMTVQASHYSRRFLERRGWTLDRADVITSSRGVRHEVSLLSIDLL